MPLATRLSLCLTVPPVCARAVWQVSQERIMAAPFGLADPGLVLVGSKSHPSRETTEFVSLFNKPQILEVGREPPAVISPHCPPFCFPIIIIIAHH